MRNQRSCMSIVMLLAGLCLSCMPKLSQLKTSCQEESNSRDCNRWAAQLEKACDEESSGRACFELAKGHLEGSGGMSQDIKSGLAYLKRSCDLHDWDGCREQEKIINKVKGKLHEKMEEMMEQVATATKACLEGSELDTCKAVLSVLTQGCEAKSEQMCQLIIPVARRSCDLGSEELCVKYATFAKASCESGAVCGCSELGRLLAYPRPPIRPNRKQAIELLRTGCQKNCSDSCKILKELGVSPY